MSSSYLIELDRWNIKEGIPSKPYKVADYVLADNNIQGINNAITYAASNNYTSAILPKGQYALCYPREIRMVSNLTFDLNSSTLKVIYDSDRKSPFDNRTTADYYNFKGNSIIFENVNNAHLVGGTIIGCRDDRSFTNVAQERRMEHTYGIVFQKSSKYSSVKHCIVRDYMGDNISFSSTAVRELVEFNLNLTLNSINHSTGQLITPNNTLATGYINIPNDGNFISFLIAGAGYARLTSLNTKEFDVFFYRADNTFIGVLKQRKIYADISIPNGAAKFRMLLYNETNPNKNMQLSVKFGLIPHHNLIEYNEVYNGHRGGITLGGSYNVIQHNVIRDNGKGSNSFLDDKPIFSDPTRYGINQEDSYGDNCVIRNNLIYGSNHGILAGCYSIQIENNHIYNMDGIAINLYSLLFANIVGNVINNCTSSIGLMTSNFSNAYVNISENSIQGGNFNFSANNTYQVNIKSNNFVDITSLNLGSSNINHCFVNNRIKFTNNTNVPGITMFKMDNCIVDSISTKEVTLKIYNIRKTTFKNVKINFQTLNDRTMSEEVTIQDSEFYGSTLNNMVLGTKDRHINIYNSKLVDSIVQTGNINSPALPSTFYISKSKIISNSLQYLFSTDINQPSGSITLNACEIEISNTTFLYLIFHLKTIVNPVFTLKILNSKIQYIGENVLNIDYYNNSRPMINLILSRNTLNKIAFPTLNPPVLLNYDPEIEYTNSVTLQAMGTNYVATVTHNLNTKDLFILCRDTSSIYYPEISYIDFNSIRIQLTKSAQLDLYIKKL